MNNLIKIIALSISIPVTQLYAENTLSEIPIITGNQLSLKKEIKLAVKRGNNFLQTQQDPKGFWIDKNLPAISALALYAQVTSPNFDKKEQENIQKGYNYLLSKVHKDGGIYGKGLANYNTSLSVMALCAANNPQYKQTIINARHFLVNLQTNWKPGPDGKENIMNGGIGYGGSYPHSDMSNTHLALHAIKTAELQMSETDMKSATKLDWESAKKFISSCQNLHTSNPLSEAGNDGSFVYFPGNSKAGTTKHPSGKVSLRGYGSMSYAGLLSLIHADLDPKDERVIAVTEWLSKNYTLDENPGLEKQGLFYYYHTMAKALSHANINTLKLTDGSQIHWREELAKKLLSEQQSNGSWINTNSRWMESEAVMTTAYANITLNLIFHSFPK